MYVANYPTVIKCSSQSEAKMMCAQIKEMCEENGQKHTENTNIDEEYYLCRVFSKTTITDHIFIY